MLKARYEFQLEAYEINEAMLAGTIAGEVSRICSPFISYELSTDCLNLPFSTLTVVLSALIPLSSSKEHYRSCRYGFPTLEIGR